MDESNIDYRNKIEEKQEDMFDPHKLQQNILQENQKSYQNNFIDFGDEDVIEETVQKPETEKKELREEKEEEEKGEEQLAKKNARKRGKREKKAIIDSDEDIKDEQPSEISKNS
jgi:hypothetical protein